jgi:hypothetical protein
VNLAQPQPRRQVPAPFGDEPTRQVDDDLLTVLRNQMPASAPSKSPSRSSPKPKLPRPNVAIPAHHDEPTRMAKIDPRGFDDPPGLDGSDFPPQFLSPAQTADPSFGSFEDHHDLDEATRLSSLEGIAAMERARNHGPSNDERTRAVNIRNDPSISDIDWDLD